MPRSGRRWLLAGTILACTALFGGLGGWWDGVPGGAVGALFGLLGLAALALAQSKRTGRREAWTAWERLGPAVDQVDWSEDDGYAALLRPDRGAVEFMARPEFVDPLLGWALDSADGPVLLVTGAAGVGKTRLALHVAARLQTEHGWLCRQVASGNEAGAVEVALGVAEKQPVLLIVDHAETRTGLTDLLTSVQRAAGRVRVLLIARAAGEWIWTLAAGLPVGRVFSRHSPMEITARVVVTDQNYEDVIRAAVPFFAKQLKVPAPEQVTIVTEDGASPPLLTLHAAALLLVLTAREGTQPRVMVGQALDEVIRHEQRYWSRAAARAGLAGDDLTMLRRAVAVACLLPVQDEDEAAAVLARVPDLNDADQERLRRVAGWLHDLYPTDSQSWLGSLEPDLFAEHHVCAELAAAPTFADACFRDLSPAQGRHALTVLARATRHDANARALLTQLLSTHLPALAEAAIEVALQTDPALGQVLAELLDAPGVDLDTLRRILAAIPYPTVTLARAAAIAADRVAGLIDGDAEPAEVARTLHSAGLRWSAVGQPAKALALTQRAVEVYERLAAANRDCYEPDLATSLTNLGAYWSEVRQPDKALVHPTRRRDPRAAGSHQPAPLRTRPSRVPEQPQRLLV